MAALGQKAAVASSNVSARASSASAPRMLYTRHLDTSAAIFAAFYLILRLPQCGASASAVRLTKTTFFPHRGDRDSVRLRFETFHDQFRREQRTYGMYAAGSSLRTSRTRFLCRGLPGRPRVVVQRSKEGFNLDADVVRVNRKNRGVTVHIEPHT